MSTNTKVKLFTNKEKKRIARGILDGQLFKYGVLLSNNLEKGIEIIKTALGFSDEEAEGFAEGLLSGKFFDSILK